MRALAILVMAALFALALGLVPGCGCSNDGSKLMDMHASVGDMAENDLSIGDMAEDDLSILSVIDMTGGPDGAGDLASCGAAGAACGKDSDCCFMMCEPTSHVCVNKQCGNVSAPCQTAADCCGLSCNSGKCGGRV